MEIAKYLVHLGWKAFAVFLIFNPVTWGITLALYDAVTGDDTGLWIVSPGAYYQKHGMVEHTKPQQPAQPEAPSIKLQDRVPQRPEWANTLPKPVLPLDAYAKLNGKVCKHPNYASYEDFVKSCQ